MDVKCCYCKRTIEGPVEYCIPEGFPQNKEHEGRPLCRECGESVEPTLDVICARLDDEWAALHSKPPLYPPHSSSNNTAQVMPPMQQMMAEVISTLLCKLPTNASRLDVITLALKDICRGCGRVLGETEKCTCPTDDL